MQRNKAKDNEVQAIIRVARWSVVCVIVMWASTFLLLLLPEGNQGTYGDMFGAVNALFSGLAFAGLIITLILQRKELSLQREDIFVERNEAKFYKMLDIYSGMTRGLEVHGVKGKAAFAELVGEFSYTYNLINQIFRTVLCEQPYLLKANNNLKNIILELKSDRDKRDAFLTDLAYNLFFYGSHYMVVDFDHPERTALGEAIKDIAFKENRKGENNTFADYVKDGVYEVVDTYGVKYVIGYNEDGFEVTIYKDQVINQSENLEELCDRYIGISNNKPMIIKYEFDEYYDEYGDSYTKEELLMEYDTIYGAIYTDKGLIYVAKLNKNGEFELI